MNSLGLSERILAADLVVTGEGSFDGQTSGGKVVAAVLEGTARARRPAVVVAGRWDGTLPPVHPKGMEVLTAQGLGLPGEALTADGLIEIGRRIGSDPARMAKAPAG